MNNLTKTFLVSFSMPKYIINSYPKAFKLIFHKYSIENNDNLDFENLNKNLYYHGFNNVTIVAVSKDPDINTVLEQNYVNEYNNITSKNYVVPFNLFFSEEGIKNFIINQNLIIRTKTNSSMPSDEDN